MLATPISIGTGSRTHHHDKTAESAYRQEAHPAKESPNAQQRL